LSHNGNPDKLYQIITVDLNFGFYRIDDFLRDPKIIVLKIFKNIPAAKIFALLEKTREGLRGTFIFREKNHLQSIILKYPDHSLLLIMVRDLLPVFRP